MSLQPFHVSGTAGGTVLTPSGDPTGVSDAANIKAAAVPGALITLASNAPWFILAGQVAINAANTRINAPGCLINGVGTGTLFRMFYTAFSGPTGPLGPYGGGLTGYPIIDGTSMGAGSTAWRAGDIFQLNTEIFVQNFSGPGVLFDNQNFWTEQMFGRIYTWNCNPGVLFNVGGALTSTASFKGADLEIGIGQVTPTYDGIVLQNGALIYDARVEYVGNFQGSASALTSTAIRTTGQVPAGHPSAGSFSGIYDSELRFGLECAAGANTPRTAVFGANGNLWKNCSGLLDFGGDGAAANFTPAVRIGNIYPFNGTILGDSVLAQAMGFPLGWSIPNGPLGLGAFQAATVIASNGTIPCATSVYKVNPAGNVTGIIISNAASFDEQVLAVTNESAFTLTMAAQATSHVAGGAAVVIPANSTSMFFFEGNDTGLWYKVA